MGDIIMGIVSAIFIIGAAVVSILYVKAVDKAVKEQLEKNKT